MKHDSTYPDSPFRPGQEGNDFLPLTAPQPGETVLAKRVTSAFIGTDLTQRLEAMGKPDLVICGVLLANSVEATVRVGANLGYRITIPADACWSSFLDLPGPWPRRHAQHQAQHQVAQQKREELPRHGVRFTGGQHTGSLGLRHEIDQRLAVGFAAIFFEDRAQLA